ncbi:MAG: selenocysteine-specific translation elongation factor, partial [Chloroflexota bacterium]
GHLIMFVLGTAGHIDHGKSVLVQALTGIDPDRLREEKERGMTIDLGFAWMTLPGGQEVGIVDVPGHETFIKNMLAGVGGIDLALLIVAANEGVMPQTREHLAILDLLEIPQAVAVITKKDLVDDEWLSLVRMEVEELLQPTTLAASPVVAVSAVTGEGMAELTAAIAARLASATPRPDLGRPRLPIDRVFTIAGPGTIVTGTLIDGSLQVGQEVEIVPAGLKSRLRGLQTHKARLDTAWPGSRVAANLVGVTTAQLQRGDVVTRPGWLLPRTMLTARLHLLPYLPRPLRHNATLSFFTGAAEALARVRLLEAEALAPGETAWVQLRLDRPVAAVRGDRFILRSPDDTLGGGKIVDTQAKRQRRFRPEVIHRLQVAAEGTTEEVIVARLETKQPLPLASLLARGDLPAAEVPPAIASLVQQGRLIKVGQGDTALLFTGAGWERLKQQAAAVVRDYHHRFPARPGIPRMELTNKLGTGADAPLILQRLAEEAVLVVEGPTARLPEHQVRLTPAQQAKIDAFLKSLAASPYAPPSELIPEPDLLNPLVARRQVVKLSEGVVLAAATYDQMVTRVTARLKAEGKITLAEVRDMFQTSRKYAQAFLEYLDGQQITRRAGDERVLR